MKPETILFDGQTSALDPRLAAEVRKAFFLPNTVP
jgi:ABC-type polar amino acid transport system ATPase subunit